MARCVGAPLAGARERPERSRAEHEQPPREEERLNDDEEDVEGGHRLVHDARRLAYFVRMAAATIFGT